MGSPCLLEWAPAGLFGLQPDVQAANHGGTAVCSRAGLKQSCEAMLKLVGGQGLLKQDQLPPSCDPCKDVRQPLYFTAPVVSACDVGLESG